MRNFCSAQRPRQPVVATVAQEAHGDPSARAFMAKSDSGRRPGPGDTEPKLAQAPRPVGSGRLIGDNRWDGRRGDVRSVSGEDGAPPGRPRHRVSYTGNPSRNPATERRATPPGS